jgi:hypothetical protein
MEKILLWPSGRTAEAETRIKGFELGRATSKVALPKTKEDLAPGLVVAIASRHRTRPRRALVYPTQGAPIMHRLRALAPIAAVPLLCFSWSPALSATDAQNCEAAVELASGKYAQCQLKAESKFTKTGDAAKLSASLAVCASKLSTAYAVAFARWSASCPTVEPASSFSAFLSQCTTEVEAAAAGGSFPACGDGAVNIAGEQCDGGDLGGESCASLGFLSGALGCTAGCTFETSACETTLCGNGAIDAPEQCDGSDLGGATCASLGYTLGGSLGCGAGCGYDLSGCESQAFPATGQTTCWDSTGTVILCTGAGHDGDVQAGGTLAYVDNGDGTITDANTGLMWEKLSDDGSIHDKDTTYSWNNAFAVKVATLNSASFAGFNDWRLPNVKELMSLINYEVPGPGPAPSVDAAFDTGCVSACTVVTCSCTFSSAYWSSSSRSGLPQNAWHVDFSGGPVDSNNSKGVNLFVRAVRGGS